MAYNYFVANINALVRNMESAAHVVLEAIGVADGGTGAAAVSAPPPAPELRTAPAGAR